MRINGNHQQFSVYNREVGLRHASEYKITTTSVQFSAWTIILSADTRLVGGFECRKMKKCGVSQQYGKSLIKIYCPCTRDHSNQSIVKNWKNAPEKITAYNLKMSNIPFHFYEKEDPVHSKISE